MTSLLLVPDGRSFSDVRLTGREVEGVAVTGSARRWAGKLLAGTSRVVGDENYRLIVDRLHRGIYPNGFVVRGIQTPAAAD